MAMRMNQQYHQRANGLGAKGKLNKNGESNNTNHGQRNPRHTSSTTKQEFKPVAILKRGEPSATSVVNEEKNSIKENIATHGQPAKTIIQRPISNPVILLSSKPTINVSPPVASPSNNVPTTPVPTPTVVHRPAGPIHLTRSTSTIAAPTLTQAQYEQHVQSISTRLLSSSTVMKSSIKLIDESLTWCENGQLNNYLQESDGFVVIGAIGREKVGKSTLLSLLGGNQFTDEDRLMIFPATSSSSNKITRGIDIYVTNEQTILLDTQPLLSSQCHQQQLVQPAVPHLWQQKIDPRGMFIDNILELQTLEIIAFILAVCHVVLIIEDQFADPYLYRLIQLAEILRPVLNRNSNDIVHTHSPHLVFVLNKCQNYISPQEQNLIKRTVAQMMVDTHFQIYSSLKTTNKIQIQTNLKHIVNDFKQQELNENLLIRLLKQNQTENDEFSINDDEENIEKNENVNAIFVPRRDFRDSHSAHWQRRFLGFPNADSIVRQLRQQLLAIDRPHIEQCQSQRAWLTHASRVWDLIIKSSQLADFSRLLT